jgi:recombination DNA repair RAD52 pathway protein
MANMAPLNASTTSGMATLSGQTGKVLQIQQVKQADATAAEPKATPKSMTFSPKKEDQSILNQTNSDPKAVPGQFNGMSSFIDGYLRIAKRRYVARGAYNVGR